MKSIAFSLSLLSLLVVMRAMPYTQAKRTSHISRGVSYWQSEDGRDKRILMGNLQPKLVALDAATGKLKEDFGVHGVVNLRTGFADRWPDSIYAVTSPPAIYKDIAIIGGEVPEYPSRGPSGAVRAFDVRSGKAVWTFRTLPDSKGDRDWKAGATTERTGGNVWSIMSVDTERGMVFLPIGSASYDFYGGDREGSNRYANSLVALDASTGKVLWHFQMVHHDIWDYDIPAQPILTTVRGVPAVVQVTKMGFVFILDRLTGEPLFPVEERAVTASEIPGEFSWPTQPYPVKPPALSNLIMPPGQLRRDSRVCREMAGGAISHGIFAPPELRTTIQTPGEIGGGNWSGGSTAAGVMFVNTNNLYSLGKMQEQPAGAPERFRRNSGKRDEAFFWDEARVPCQLPPYGMLTAVQLDSGEIKWRRPLPTINIGGSIVTAGGLVFLGATTDDRLRAFDAETGRELWAAELPASAHATPVTYRSQRTGKQYVAVAAGGGGIFPGRVADEMVAYTLP